MSILAVACGACGGGGIDIGVDPPPPLPEQPQVTVEGHTKQLVFSWAAVTGADHYRLMENSDGHSGFAQVGDNIPAGTLTVNRDIAVHLFDWIEAQYMVDACNVTGCSSSDVVTATGVMLDTVGYFKASNTGWVDHFGGSVALSADGSTLAVGAYKERSGATGINGDQADNSTDYAGAVYLFRFDGTSWYQQAYVKASNTDPWDEFGQSVALSADGDTLAVGARKEDSNATGINGDQADNSSEGAGAAYVFRFDGTDWNQQAYVKASNTDPWDEFGHSVALSADGDTLAVSASDESSNATGINGEQADNSSYSAGAVYLFRFDGTDWSQRAYIKSSNPDIGDWFGSSMALSSDGNTLAAGARWEDSSATGIDGDQADNSSGGAGAVYVFRFDGTDWSQRAYVKASNTDPRDEFGKSVALSADGNILAVGAFGEDSVATGINGDQADNSSQGAGAVYLFRFDGTDWFQQVYVKASYNEPDDGYFPDTADLFGWSVALSGDGYILAVGEDVIAEGAVSLFRFDGTDWYEKGQVKAPTSDFEDWFGSPIALTADGGTMAVGAALEDSSSTGINGDQDNNFAPEAGAVFVY